MAKRVFQSDLSVKGIENLRKQLQNYKEVILKQKLLLITQKLANLGVQIAKANVAKLGAVFTGELEASIHATFGGQTNNYCVFYVVADSEHAVFVEFGTGQLGIEGSYPYPLPPGIDWEYNTGKTIFQFSPGQYGWFYYKDGAYYFTQGMPARPFMFETSLDLYKMAAAVVMEVFST